MCLPGEWDDSYTYNFNSMFQEGMCIKQVRTDIVNGDFSGCDVRVFNQAATSSITISSKGTSRLERKITCFIRHRN